MGADQNIEAVDRNGRPHALAAVIGRLRAAIVDERTEVRALIEALEQASFTPVLLLPALIIVSPLSGIPILPSICGISIALIVAQMLAGRRHLWLPDWILARSLDSGRLRKALDWLDKPAGWVDGATRHRLGALAEPPFRPLFLLACAACGLAMPALEILPFTSSILAGAVVLIALGLLVHDGLVALLGLGVVWGGVLLVLTLWP